MNERQESKNHISKKSVRKVSGSIVVTREEEEGEKEVEIKNRE